MKSHGISLISRGAPTHDEIQPFAKLCNISKASGVYRTSAHHHSRTPGCCHSLQGRHQAGSVPAGITANRQALLCVLDVVKRQADFHSRAVAIYTFPIISVHFHGFHLPYLPCSSVTHLQHPSPHSYRRTQLLPLFPKKSMHIKHFASFLLFSSFPPSLPPPIHSFLRLIELTIRRACKGQRVDSKREHVAEGCPSNPLSPLLPALPPLSLLSHQANLPPLISTQMLWRVIS